MCAEDLYKLCKEYLNPLKCNFCTFYRHNYETFEICIFLQLTTAELSTLKDCPFFGLPCRFRHCINCVFVSLIICFVLLLWLAFFFSCLLFSFLIFFPLSFLCCNLFVFDTSLEIGWEEHLQYDLFSVEWDAKP